MKRVQMFLAGAFIAVGSLYAQSSDAEWQMEVAKLKETIQSDPAQAAEQAEQLIKGKNKKNVELLTAIGEAYLQADKLSEAQMYAVSASRVLLLKKRMASLLWLPCWKGILRPSRKMQVLLHRSMRKLFILIRVARLRI